MKRVFLQWLQIAAGLLVFALGVHLTIFANIGLAPWDCLGMGIARHTPLNYGLSMTAMALVILGIDLLLKERIGFGTIIDALLTGNFVQMFNDLNPFPANESLWAGVGLMVFAFGVHLTIHASIGLAPWDCFGMGLANRTPLTYGAAMTLTSLVILLIDLLLRERIGFGTVIDALLTGNFTDLFNRLDPLPENGSLPLGVAIMLAGLTIMAVGQWIYMRAAQCCGPRDSLLVGLGKRLPRVPIGIVEILLWAAVLLAGWLLGGPVGVGTLISTFGAGLVMQLVYGMLRFEPRSVVHRDVVQAAREIAGK